MWHSLTVHGGTSQGGLRAFAIVAGTSRVIAGGMQLDGQFPVMGDGDDDMPALVDHSDGEEIPEQNAWTVHGGSSQEARRVTTFDARTVPRRFVSLSTLEIQILEMPTVTDSHDEDMPPLLPPDDSDDNEELPALLPNAAARQRPQPEAPGPCQCRHSLAGGFAKPGRQD